MTYHQYQSHCGCHQLPVAQCPGPMPSNQQVAGPSVECVACPIVLSNLPTDVLYSSGQLKPGMFHYSPLRKAFFYVETGPNGTYTVHQLDDSMTREEILAMLPTSQDIINILTAMLTPEFVLSKIECSALKGKCGLVDVNSLGQLVTFEATQFDITALSNGGFKVSLKPETPATTLTAAQISYLIANAPCQELKSKMASCRICEDWSMWALRGAVASGTTGQTSPIVLDVMGLIPGSYTPAAGQIKLKVYDGQSSGTSIYDIGAFSGASATSVVINGEQYTQLKLTTDTGNIPQTVTNFNQIWWALSLDSGNTWSPMRSDIKLSSN